MIGGGVGIYPLYFAARKAEVAVDAVLGFRTERIVNFEHKFAPVCRSLAVTTDDGTYGRPGLVTEPAREMLERQATAPSWPAAPGGCSGRCRRSPLNLTCRASFPLRKEWDAASERVSSAPAKRREKRNKTVYSHVCKDGPVFDAKDVIFDD